MVCTRSKLTLKKPHNKTLENPTTTNIFKNLISALESHEGIKSQLLKSSYYLLIQLSSKRQLSLGEGVDLNELFVKTNDGEVRLTFRDVYTFSCILFKVLQKRLKQLHSSKHDVTASQSLEAEEVNLLIRCCLVSLTLCVPQEHLLESGRVFLLILKKLSLLEVALGSHESADLYKSHSCQCTYIGENSSDSFAKVASLSSLQLFEPCIPSIRTILEVLIDELLVNSRLRKYLQIIDSLSPGNERLFKHGMRNGNFGVMMEIICSHFAISMSNEGALEFFLNKITWVHSNNSKSLELSITARTLLQNPIVLSSPKLLQAHIVSLVSDVISIGIDSETPTPDPRLIDCYLSVFESSVMLYTQHMSIMKTESHSDDARGSLVNLHNENSQASFESCIDPIKWQKLNQMIITLNDSWNSNLRRKFFRSESDLIASSLEYIKQNMCILDITWREDILCFLRCMLMRAANDVNDIELPLNGEASLQDICLLSSLLMLMSKSLIQAVCCLRYQYPNSITDILVCKEYDVILGILDCFKEFSIRLPIQKVYHNLMEKNSNPTSHKESRLMLLHFIGLVSLCFDSGLDFLVKSCISVVMALTNLFVLEEGNTDALRSLADPRSLSSQGSLTIYKEMKQQYPTFQVAAKFQKMRTLYVSNASIANESILTEDMRVENLSSTLVPLSMEGVAVTEETCSGEIFLKSRNVTDFDDLADFVECKKDKDYVGWLKDREKFREWKLRKQVKHRLEKKRKAWRSMRGSVGPNRTGP